MPTPSKGQRTRAARHALDQEQPADVHGELLSVEAVDSPIPEPSAIKAMWFPAIIQVPGEEPRYKGKAYATPEGLYVYWAVPAQTEPGVENWTPDWYSEIDYEATKRPPTGWASRNGFFIHTAKGRVTITMENGCGCHSPLKRWSPQFAQRMVSW